jgi:putative sigma-54 modulation protein
MNVEISGRNYEVTDRIRKLINDKLAKVDRFFVDVIDARCVLSVEKYRNICEIIIIGKLQDVKSVQEADNMEDAIVATIDHLKRQAQKNRNKIRDHHRGGRTAESFPESWQVQVLARGTASEETRGPRIIETENLPIRRMSVEQAAMLLDDSKNAFLVFRDLDNEKVTVIYRRNDQNFGVIAPEF